MIGVDTNLLVRILTNDDPIQARRAVKVLQGDDIYITKTVLLETLFVVAGFIPACMQGGRMSPGLSRNSVRT
jgi:predicted nucleic-acid-binding protein